MTYFPFVVCCITYENKVWNNVWLLRFVFVHDCDIFFISLQLPYLFVWCSYDFDDARITLYFGTFELRMEMTWKLHFVFVRHCDVFFVSLQLFVIVTYFLLRHNYVICLFDVIMFFNDVRITLYFGTFELRMETTLQLRFVLVRHCNVFFITSQLRYLFVRCS